MHKNHCHLFDKVIAPSAIDYEKRLSMLTKKGIVVPLTAAEFKSRSESLIQETASIPEMALHLNDPVLPIVLPSLQGVEIKVLMSKIIAVAGANYKEQSGREFDNHHIDRLLSLLIMEETSAYWGIINKLHTEPTVALYYPLPLSLRGQSIQAQRHIISLMPKRFIGSGVLDTAVALAMYPDVLLAEEMSPGYCCPEMSWFVRSFSPCFRCVAGTLLMNYMEIDSKFDDYCGGLLYIEK